MKGERMLRLKMLATIVALLAVAGLQAQRPSTKGSGTLTGVDYAEIQRLYYQYAWAYDSCAENGQAFARVFTPDGVFVAGGRVIEGRAKLAEFAKCPDRMSLRPTQHWIGNVLIMPSPEGATGSAYVMQVNTAEPKLSTSGGRYEDIIGKGPDGWAINERADGPAPRPAASTRP